MINYMRADLYRINRRIPRIIWILICFGIAAVILFLNLKDVVWNSVNYTASVCSGFSITGVILGFFEMIYIFSDDFKAKSMQVAIGGGTNRFQVVLTKFFEVVILVFFDMLILFACFLIFGAASEIQLLREQIWEMFVIMISEVLQVSVFTSFTMIILFYFQSAGVSVLSYLLVAADPINLLLQVLEANFTVLMNLHLTTYTYSAASGMLRTQLVFGKLSISALVLIIIYIVVGIAATVFLFNKRELEF